MINFGNGPNTLYLRGRCGGSSVKYTGGDNADDATIGLLARSTKVKVDLKKGADAFPLQANTTLHSLSVDLGKGVDTFTDNMGFPVGGGGNNFDNLMASNCC